MSQNSYGFIRWSKLETGMRGHMYFNLNRPIHFLVLTEYIHCVLCGEKVDIDCVFLNFNLYRLFLSSMKWLIILKSSSVTQKMKMSLTFRIIQQSQFWINYTWPFRGWEAGCSSTRPWKYFKSIKNILISVLLYLKQFLKDIM